MSRFDQFTYCINAIDLHWHRIASAEMKAYGLKGSTAIYFTQLLNNPEGVTASELAAVCGRDKADVSRELALLEKADLVTRAESGKRGYRAPIRLTEKGRELAQEIIRKADMAVEIVGQELSDEERETFYRALEKITQRIQTLSENGLPD